MLLNPAVNLSPRSFLVGKIPYPYAPWCWYIYQHVPEQNHPNVGKYTIHGAYGISTILQLVFLCDQKNVQGFLPSRHVPSTENLIPQAQLRSKPRSVEKRAAIVFLDVVEWMVLSTSQQNELLDMYDTAWYTWLLYTRISINHYINIYTFNKQKPMANQPQNKWNKNVCATQSHSTVFAGT